MFDFLSIDPEQIQEDAIAAYEDATGQFLFAGDERRVLINTMAGLLVVALGKLNGLLNDDFPQYAEGSALDVLGASRNVIRIPAQAALVTLRYTLSAVQGADITIPAGTRATPDNAHYFATTEELTIDAGQTTGTVTAQATETGSDYNDFQIGTITNQVDLVAYVASVTNTDVSQGGAAVEDDDSYRQRIILSLAAYTSAGSELSYIYWAMGSDSTISDVTAVSPSAGQVIVTVLLEGGAIPTQPILDKVTYALSARDVRPLTDQVTVHAPTQTLYTLDVEYCVDEVRQSQITKIQAAVEAAVAAYVTWQGTALGRHINPNKLVSMMMEAGAGSVVVNSPAFASLDPDHIAVLSGSATITYDGLI